MRLTRNRKLGAATVATLAVAGAGGAFAATKLTSPGDRSRAVIDDAAQQLGVNPDRLSAALRKALENQIDAEVTAGRLTKEQGEELKRRIESSDFPLLGLRGLHRGFDFDRHGGLFARGFDAAATYLGISESELRAQLLSGKSLAEVAKAQRKSVDGLVDTLVADARKQIEGAVDAGRLTRAQADQIEADLKNRVQRRVNATLPLRSFRPFGGRPPLAPPAFRTA
jgi:hypothetical protein